MKARKVLVTRNQAGSLLKSLSAQPVEPVGSHLSDDEFIDYALESLGADEVRRVDEHLESCSDCAASMGELLEAAEAWRGARGKERLAGLRGRLRSGAHERAVAAAATPGSPVARLREALAELLAAPTAGVEEASALLGKLRQLVAEAERQMPGTWPFVWAPVPARILNRGWLEQAGLAAASAGERAYIVNTRQEVSFEWVREPAVDRDGTVTLAIRLDPRALPIAEDQEFVVDALYLGTCELVAARTVGPEERLDVDSPRGLTLRAQLPDLDDESLGNLGARLDQRGAAELRLSTAAFALRVWWQAGDQAR